MDSHVRRTPAEWLIAACGMWHIGLGLYFILLRPALLPEDVRYMGTDLQSLRVVAPHIGDWLGKVFTVMGGFMAGAGRGGPVRLDNFRAELSEFSAG